MSTHKLTRREESRIIKTKNDDYKPDPRGLGYAFYYAMLLNKDEVAQIDAESGEIDSYGSLLRRCIRVCMHLLFKGITKDDVVCQCCYDHLNSCVPLICSYFLGLKAALLDPTLSLNEMTDLLYRIRPRIIFVGTEAIEVIIEALDSLKVSCEVVVFGATEQHTLFDDFLKPVTYESEFIPLPVESLEETAVILFSDKKEIRLSHYCLLIQLKRIVCCCNLGNLLYLSGLLNERRKKGFRVMINFFPNFWLLSVHMLNSALLTGATRVICRNFETASIWKLIDKYYVSFLTCTTHQAVQFYKKEKPENVHGDSLGMIFTIGTRFTPSDLYQLRKTFPRCFITNSYDRFEIGGPFTMFNYNESEHIRDQYENPTSCGKLVPGVTCKIVDPHTEKILGVNKAGELRYKANFVCSSVVFDIDGWIRTNDIAFYDNKLCFYVLDSYEDVLKYKCWHIVPSVIETVIKEHPCVNESVVIDVRNEDGRKDAIPVAIVSLKKEMKNRVTIQDISVFTNSILPKEHNFKGSVKIMKEISVTSRGEPRRKELRTMVQAGLL